MGNMNRKDFLKAGVTLVGTTALMPAVFRNTMLALEQTPTGGAPQDDGRVLVVVQMAGGNDGLNTVVPVSDGRYYDARSNIAVAQAAALSLNATTGLHPSMTKLKDLWDQGVVAVVEGVGYPQPNYSHFVSMDIWQTADPGHKLSEGWLGRYFSQSEARSEAPFLGLAISSTMPKSFSTPRVSVPAVPGLAGYQFQGDPEAPFLASPRLGVLKAMYSAGSPAGDYGALLDATMRAADISTNTLQKAHQEYKPAVTYPSDGLGPAFQIVAGAIAGNTGVKVCHVTIGGFDTHANESVDQAKQLSAVANGVNAFYNDLKAHKLDSRVLIMTWSEFGRRVKSNASGGTDHGSAAPLFFIGTPVKGGMYGERPSLANLDNGNLRYTTDFRRIYATASEGWLRAPSKDLLGGSFEQIPLFR